MFLLQVRLRRSRKEKRASTNPVNLAKIRLDLSRFSVCLEYHDDIFSHKVGTSFCPKKCTGKCVILDSCLRICCIPQFRYKMGIVLPKAQLYPCLCKPHTFLRSTNMNLAVLIKMPLLTFFGRRLHSRQDLYHI